MIYENTKIGRKAAYFVYYSSVNRHFLFLKLVILRCSYILVIIHMSLLRKFSSKKLLLRNAAVRVVNEILMLNL